MAASVVINRHTTASLPHPHVVYVVEVTVNSTRTVIERRYSEFVALHESLRDGFPFPPKRVFLTLFFPSAWVDDQLVAERKAGLAKWLSAVLWAPEYQNVPLLQQFLSRDAIVPFTSEIDVEDVLPSTLSRKAISSFFSIRQTQKKPSMISAAYYPEWCVGDHSPEDLDFTKFDLLFFGFVTPNADSKLGWGPATSDSLKRLVTSARSSQADTKVVLTIGGWEGSRYFSQTCSTMLNRMTFVEAVVAAVNEHDLDGINLDFEFPNSKGSGNPYSPEDTANFLLLIQALRTALGASKIISAAVGHTPWLGPEGVPISNATAFAENLTYINIMNYSVYASSSPGPNSPLGDVIKSQRKLQTTAEAALLQWRNSGFPASKMLLGIPLFGYVFKSKRTYLNSGNRMVPNQTFESFASHSFKGAHKDMGGKSAEEMTTTTEQLESWWNKPIPFKQLVASGALVKRFDGNYGQGSGYTMAWDDSSSTPYLFNPEKKVLVTFDNTRSLAAKVKFAQENGFAGCATWSLDHDDGYTLQDVIRTAMGKYN
ncbi:glycoside hydrolase family 18 protein [Agrocybe pediades]|nr:glycoside hydrolase family 18 protein [Agrocybe pediades]